MFKRILLAVDGSEHSVKATDYAIALAQKFDGAVEAVYVVDTETMRRDALEAVNQQEIERMHKGRMEPFRRRLDEGMITFWAHILHGDPGPTIVKFAEEEKFDTIVIGNRRLKPLQSAVLGSVSQYVAKRAHCDVIIVK